MKLWEVMKALEENPGKKFVLKGRDEVIGTTRLARGITVAVDDNQFQYVAELEFSDDWQEVKSPVTWQEAIEAWVNGKTIKCATRGANFVFEGYKPRLRDQLDTIDRTQLRDGTWYIGED